MSCASLRCLAVMFVGLIATASLFAQQSPPTRIRPLPLLVSESVQKEIKLTDDQKAQVIALHGEFQKAVEKLRADTTGDKDFRDASDEERAKWFEGIKKVNDDFEPKTKEVLKPEQFERAQQIAYQFQGPQALRNPDVVKVLELTSEQQEKLAAVVKEYQEKYRAVYTDDALSGPEKTAQGAKLREAHWTDATKVLTTQQNEKLEALRGKAFDVSTIRPAVSSRR